MIAICALENKGQIIRDENDFYRFNDNDFQRIEYKPELRSDVCQEQRARLGEIT